MDSGLGGWNLWYLAVGAVVGALFGLILEAVYGWSWGNRQKIRISLEEQIWDDGLVEVRCHIKNEGSSYVDNIRLNFTILNIGVKWFTFENTITAESRGLDELKILFPAYDDNGNVVGALYGMDCDIPGLHVGAIFPVKFLSYEQLDVIRVQAHIGDKHWKAEILFADDS